MVVASPDQTQEIERAGRKDELRRTVVMRRVLRDPVAVKGCAEWLRRCLSSNAKDRDVASVQCVFALLSSLGEEEGDGYDGDARRRLIDALDPVFDDLVRGPLRHQEQSDQTPPTNEQPPPRQLPLMLRLRERELEKLADCRIVRSLIDRKLGQPLASLAVLADGVAVLGMLGCFVLVSNLMVRRTDALATAEVALLAVAAVCAVFLLAREAAQAKAMASIRMLDSSATDPWNVLDVISPLAVLSVAGVAGFGGGFAREANAFRMGVAVSSFLAWCVWGVASACTFTASGK